MSDNFQTVAQQAACKLLVQATAMMQASVQIIHTACEMLNATTAVENPPGNEPVVLLPVDVALDECSNEAPGVAEDDEDEIMGDPPARDHATFGSWMLAKRMQNAMTHDDLAALIGLNQVDIVLMEQDRLDYRLETLGALTRSFGRIPFGIRYPALGNLVYLVRKKYGLSSAEFAERVGVNRRAIRRWERGQYRPAQKYLDRMIECFDLPSNYFQMSVNNYSENRTAA